jgi:WD40 repeat protein
VQGSDDKLVQPAEAGPPSNPEAETGKQRPQIQALAFSPDGQRLASGSQDGTIQIWTPTAVLAEEVCQKVWRNLTLDEWQQFVGKGIPYERTCPDLQVDRSEEVET